MNSSLEWKLISYEERPAFLLSHEREADGDHHVYPRWLYVSTTHEADRKPFASGDWFKATYEEYKQEASAYIAYSGPFHVDEERKTLTHSMFVSLFPNWLGQTQPRAVRIEGDDLYLSTATPIHSQGKTVNSYLHWKRASKV